ncbi:RNA polymerase sigma factor [Quatrionicoccus australiensis]|uniref:RNA polymerase sigma factor n=1 Tax=Quatrionicoccus australiensis TaxID=138118 RepID=UPI001CFBB973|nr:sigma-70 family RNA polymerase sigma factor [Quatrionicoccus australiensis]MCB4360968.1 sigma-70 family RNA polymerase sigma factor [Quatrionicoccus australiensis]
MPSAIASLYIDHIGEIRRFLTRRLSCVEVATELAQEVFVRYLLAAPQRPVDNPRAFLFRIAGNLAIDHGRANPLSAAHWVDIEECADLVSDYPSPERFAIARQEVERLRRAIDALPPKCRAVFIRHKFDGVPQARLAQEYRVTLNAIEKHLVRALISLRLQVMPA